MRATAAILLFAALVLLPGLGRMPAMDSTDARYLEISRAMYASGDWIVPRLANVPHLDKPPLTYWAAALGYAALGVSPLAGRLPAELALACTALLVALVGRRWCGGKGAGVAACVLLSSALVFADSRGLSTDLLQLLLFTGAMFALLRGVEGAGQPAFVVLALLLLGVSMNVKGPIALFVAAFIWTPFLALTRGRTHLSWRALALGFLLFAALGAPWYLTLWARDPAVMRYFVETQLLGRVTGNAPGVHLHPPHYLFGVWPLALLPWTPLIALSLWRLRPRSRWRDADPIDLYLLLWCFAPLLFFSIPRSKLPTYLLVGMPAAALALGRALEQGRLADRVARRTLAACVALACGAALALAVGLLLPGSVRSGKFDPELLMGGPAFAAALLAVAVLLGFSAYRLARRGASLARRSTALALGTGLILVIGFNALAPGMCSHRDEGRMARSVPGAWLIQAGIDRLSALYYFGNVERFRFAASPFREGSPPPNPYWEQAIPIEEAIALMRGEAPVFCLTRERYVSALAEPTGSVVVRRRREGTVLLANRAAQAALAAPTRSGLTTARADGDARGAQAPSQ